MSISRAAAMGLISVGFLFLNCAAERVPGLELHFLSSLARSTDAQPSELLSVAKHDSPQELSSAPETHCSPLDNSMSITVAIAAPYSTTSWDQRNRPLGKYNLPLIYLHREGQGTAEWERTLEVEIAGLNGGSEIRLEAESRHVNISSGDLHTVTHSVRLPERPCSSEEPCAVTWTLDAAVMYSDFYDLLVLDAAGNTLWDQTCPDRPDFVALDIWDVQVGSAPGPMYTARVYYATLFPFAKKTTDVANRLSPTEVTAFVAGELVPIIRSTWETQMEAWGFGTPIHPDWDLDNVVEIIITDPPFALFNGTGTYHLPRSEDGRPYPERRLWWFATNNEFQKYKTLSDGYRVVLAHEFFHLAQWNVVLSAGCGTERWRNVFNEAQANMVPSIQYRGIELANDRLLWANGRFMRAANRLLTQRLNSSYHDLEADRTHRYDVALYWRFLYEQYGEIAIIRVAQEEMACGYELDIVSGMPRVMDRVFQRVDGPFRSYEESLISFARANYALRLDNGRCLHLDGCERDGTYYDPSGIYADPPLDAELLYRGTALSYDGAVPSSFGMDFIEIRLDPALQGQPLTLRFRATGSAARFNVQVWKLGQGQEKPRALARALEAVPADRSGTHTYAIPSVNTAAYYRLALIITRLDADEATDPLGAYRLTVNAGL